MREASPTGGTELDRRCWSTKVPCWLAALGLGTIVQNAE